MSDSELQDQLMILDKLTAHQALNDELQSLDDLLGELQEEEAAATVPAPLVPPEPTVRWKKRDIDGNQIYARPSSSRNLLNQ
ncbi:hypothetical protein JOB18_019672, partial [Solea senegalensis]